ncbi:MAG: FeoA family protein [Bacteroidia bacterium]
MSSTLHNLTELAKGESAIIDSFTDTEISAKLLEMGCIPGEKVLLEKKAPTGDPIAINLSGYVLSLRLSEAKAVQIRKINPL